MQPCNQFPQQYARWYYRWLKPENSEWIKLETGSSDHVEEEYQECKEGKRKPQTHVMNYGLGVDMALLDTNRMLGYEYKPKEKDEGKETPIAELKRIEETIDYQWWWKKKEKWIPVDLFTNVTMEGEWQAEQKGERKGQRVYHVFGDGRTTLVGFEEMQTGCGSGKCPCYGSSSHNVFPIKRIP